MELTWRRTLSFVFIFVSLSDVFDHSMVQAEPISYPPSLVKEVNNEYSNENSRSSSSQLMNTLLTLARAKGVFPDSLPTYGTTSILQSQTRPNLLLEEPRLHSPIVDVPLVTPPNPVNAPVFQKPEIPLPSSPQPFQAVSGTYVRPGLSRTVIPSLAISHDINQVAVLTPPPPAVVPLQAYSSAQSEIEHARPLYHVQTISGDSYPTITPVIPEITQINYGTIPAAKDTAETFDYATETLINEFQPTIDGGYGQTSISLPINMPDQNSPAAAPVLQAEYLPYQMYPPPMPPIIIEGSRSKLKNWLPIIMIALLSDGRQGRSGNGYCGCGCSCKCGNSNISIPYPIPVPSNNPIVGSSRSRSPHNR